MTDQFYYLNSENESEWLSAETLSDAIEEAEGLDPAEVGRRAIILYAAKPDSNMALSFNVRLDGNQKQTAEGVTVEVLPHYQQIIKSIRPSLTVRECAGVEAHMRCEYGTLDHLSRERFDLEITLAMACESEQPGYLAMIAESYGL